MATTFSKEEIEAAIEKADDQQIIDEMKDRDWVFCVWDEDGEPLAGEIPDFADDTIDGEHSPALDEAIVRFRRGEILEALIHLERAIPDLSGLHDAVRNLKASGHD